MSIFLILLQILLSLQNHCYKCREFHIQQCMPGPVACIMHYIEESSHLIHYFKRFSG
jgi:hypothetical protein